MIAGFFIAGNGDCLRDSRTPLRLITSDRAAVAGFHFIFRRVPVQGRRPLSEPRIPRPETEFPGNCAGNEVRIEGERRMEPESREERRLTAIQTYSKDKPHRSDHNQLSRSTDHHEKAYSLRIHVRPDRRRKRQLDGQRVGLTNIRHCRYAAPDLLPDEFRC